MIYFYIYLVFFVFMLMFFVTVYKDRIALLKREWGMVLISLILAPISVLGLIHFYMKDNKKCKKYRELYRKVKR